MENFSKEYWDAIKIIRYLSLKDARIVHVKSKYEKHNHMVNVITVFSIGLKDIIETHEIESGWFDVRNKSPVLNVFNQHIYNLFGTDSKLSVYGRICEECNHVFFVRFNSVRTLCDACSRPYGVYRGLIYLVVSASTNKLKIGYTSNLKKRLRQISNASGTKVELISSFPGDMAMEKEAHKRFDHFRCIGEWFEYDDSIINFFKSQEVNP